jgi:hypothetical protein
MISGLLYATAFSVSYFVLTEFTAFATMLMLLGLLFIIPRKEYVYGYSAIVSGFFTKLFPAILLPYIILFDLKKKPLKEVIYPLLKVIAVFIVVFIVPLCLLNIQALDPYLVKVGGESRGLFASSVPYLIHSWINGLFGIVVSADILSGIGLVIAACICIFCGYYIYKSKTEDMKDILKVTVLSTFAIVMAIKFNSPNYYLWMTPLICILVVTDIKKIFIFYVCQLISYAIFPLSFAIFWTNEKYIGATGTPSWQVALMLFTINAVMWIILVVYATNPMKMYNKLVELQKTDVVK